MTIRVLAAITAVMAAMTMMSAGVKTIQLQTAMMTTVDAGATIRKQNARPWWSGVLVVSDNLELAATIGKTDVIQQVEHRCQRRRDVGERRSREHLTGAAGIV